MSEAPGLSPRSRPAWAGVGAFAGILLPWLIAGASVSERVLGWIRNSASSEATSAADSRHEADRRHQFEVSVDQRLNELKDWQRQADMDREVVRNALQAKIDELTARFNQRKEARDEQFGFVSQRLSALELKWCVFANRKISECR